MNRRIDLARHMLGKNKLKGFLINNPSNLFYFTGINIETGFLLITEKEAVLFVPALLFGEAKKKAHKIVVNSLDTKKGLNEIKSFINKRNINYLGVEDSISVGLWKKFKNNFKDVKLILQNNVIERMRWKKDKEEINLIRKSADCSVKTFNHIKNCIECGQKEWEVYNEIINFINKQGSEYKLAFDPIVAYGKNTAYPHYRLKNKVLRKKDIILIDLGCKYCGYASDLTRMIFLDTISRLYNDMYGTLLKARDAVLNIIKPGVKCSVIDTVPRDIIAKGGYGDFFIHSIGHGVGIDIHETPYFNSNSKEILEEGMVFTVEPGIYIPQKGGMRIEDMVLVTKSGCEILTEER